MSRSFAFGEFLCPGCGGIANVIIQEQPPRAEWHTDPTAAPPSVTWWEPWQAYASVELVCQGPLIADDGDYDDDGAAVADAAAELPPGAPVGEVFAAAVNALADRGELGHQDDDDSAWDHAGTAIDLLATRYTPICLN